jgi:sugar lactone lactonase YvrE
MISAFAPPGYADLYVTSRDSDSELRYNEVTGAFVKAFVPSGSGGLSSPRGVIFGPDGNLYVSSNSTDSVMRYDGATGAPLPASGQTGAFFVPSGSGGLGSPAGLIFGRDGNLYVSSQTNNSVMRYNGMTGDFIDVFVNSGSGGLNSPTGLVFGPDGNLYVSSAFSNSVMRYDGATGAPLPAPGQTGAVFATIDVRGPVGLVFGPDGNLYVAILVGADLASSKIMRFDGTTGDFIDTFVSAVDGGVSALVFGPDNNLYASNTFNSRVLRYDGATGALIDIFIPSGSGGLLTSHYLCFRNSDPTTLVYVPPPHSHFLITAAPTAVAGMPFDITVTALDASGNLDMNYQGTVTFSSSDAYPGLLPADYTFTSSDQGTHTFSGGVTLYTAGTQSLTVQDTADSSLTGNATVAVVAAPASQLLITAPANAVSGTPFDVILTALDPYANVDTNYGGTVTWTSSDTDPGVILPPDYTFQATDNGMVTFPGGVTLITLGNQTLTATDTMSGITGSATVMVGP